MFKREWHDECKRPLSHCKHLEKKSSDLESYSVNCVNIHVALLEKSRHPIRYAEKSLEQESKVKVEQNDFP